MEYRLVVVVLVIGAIIGYSINLFTEGLKTSTTPTTSPPTTTTITELVTKTIPKIITSTTTAVETKTIEKQYRLVVDAIGNLVELEEPPKTIASLAPSITEIICLLGSCNRLVVVDSFSTQIEGVPRDISDAGGYWSPSIEAIVEASPDIVFLCSGVPTQEQLGEQLLSYGISIFYLRCDRARDIDDILWDVEAVATIIGVDSEPLVASIRDRISRLRELLVATNTTPPSIVLIVYLDEKSIWVAGGGTFQDYIITTSGGSNSFSNLYGWQMIGFEHLVARDPDYIVITAMGPEDVEKIVDIVEGSLLAESRAYSSGNICILYGDAADVISRPGPRIADAVYLLASILYRGYLDVEVPEYLEGSYSCLGG